MRSDRIFRVTHHESFLISRFVEEDLYSKKEKNSKKDFFYQRFLSDQSELRLRKSQSEARKIYLILEMEKVGILSEEINENLEQLRNRISDLETENENLKSLLNSKTHQLDKTIEILVKVHQKFQKVTQKSNIKNGHGSKMDSQELVRGQVHSKYPNFFDGVNNLQKKQSEHLNGEQYPTPNNGQSNGLVNGTSGMIVNGFSSMNGSSSANGTSADEIAEFAEVEEIVVSEDDSVSRNSKDDSFAEAVLGNLGSDNQNNFKQSHDIIGNGCQITPVCDLPEIRPGAKYNIGYDEIDESLNLSNGDGDSGSLNHSVTEQERLENCKNENGMYYCPECNYNTAEKQRFKRHFLVHTGEKPFKCSFPGCFKSFRYSSDYKIHLRGHDAMRAHDAKVKGFARKLCV